MFDFVHDADDGHDIPTGSDLLVEAGLDRRAIDEVLRGGGGAE